MESGWEVEEGDTIEERVTEIVNGLVRLARSDEACRLLGVDGTLEDEVDVTFLNDPVAWIANEIAGALQEDTDSEEESDVAPLSSLVALVRLYGILIARPIIETELRDEVLGYLQDGD